MNGDEWCSFTSAASLTRMQAFMCVLLHFNLHFKWMCALKLTPDKSCVPTPPPKKSTMLITKCCSTQRWLICSGSFMIFLIAHPPFLLQCLFNIRFWQISIYLWPMYKNADPNPTFTFSWSFKSKFSWNGSQREIIPQQFWLFVTFVETTAGSLSCTSIKYPAPRRLC